MIGGSDVDMESFGYAPHLPDLVREGELEEAWLDDAVRRVLRLKFELGLFDDPYQYINQDREKLILFSSERPKISQKVVEASIVLLKNDNQMLPLEKGDKIALIGALADDKDAPLGN
jgi:beta-glucosidase